MRHWERTIRLQTELASGKPDTGYGAHVQALEFLISANWLVAEAAREGLRTSSAALKRQAREQNALLSKTLGKPLAATGRSSTDVEFEARATLAAEQLRDAVSRRVPPVTEADIASDYQKRHRDLFRHETRVVDLIEQIKTRAEAIALAQRLGTGEQFTARALHETVDRPMGKVPAYALDHDLLRAIFDAPIEQVAGPVKYVGRWVILVVRNASQGAYVLPADAERVAARLDKRRRQRAFTAFLSQLQHRWKARTICRIGFVVPMCAESHEPMSSMLIALL